MSPSAVRRLTAWFVLLFSLATCSVPGIAKKTDTEPYAGQERRTAARHDRPDAARHDRPDDTTQVRPAVSPAARALADAVLKAYGGYAKLKELDERSFKSTGKIHQFSTISSAANVFESETFSRGQKTRSKIDLMGQPLITGYDGSRCWIQQGDQVFPADPTTTQRIVEEIKHGLVLLITLGEPGARIELKDNKIIDGRPATGLDVYAEDGRPTTFYIDDATKLVVSSQYEGTDLEQGLSAVKRYDYFDNRPVFGSIMPFKIVEYSNTQKSSETEVLTIEAADVKDDFFSMPSEKPIARLKEGPVVIPFEYVSNEIVINATINDRVTMRFLVDTGATQSILDQKLAQSIGQYKESNFAITTGSGHMKMNYMSLDKLDLGELTLKDIPVAVTNLSSFSHLIGNKPAGLLGANILKRFAVTVDYEKRQLILGDPNGISVPSGAKIVRTKPALGVSGLAVDGVIDGKVKATCLVDTGAAFNNISESVVKPILPSALLPVGEVLGLDGRKITTSSVRFKSLSLDDVTIDNPVFSVSPSSTKVPAGLFSGGTRLAVLGNPLWSKYRLTIDYRGQRLILEQNEDKKAEQSILSELNQIQLVYRQDLNPAQAIAQLRELAGKAQVKGLPALEALALANAALIEGEQAIKSKSAKTLQSAESQFARAERIAEASGSPEVQAKVLAMWCQIKLTNAQSTDELASARRMLGRATKYAPTEPLVGTVAGRILYSMNQKELADKLIDQALALDPSNWNALITKYKMSSDAGKTETARLTEAQIKYYYPSANLLKALASVPAVRSFSAEGKSEQTGKPARQ